MLRFRQMRGLQKFAAATCDILTGVRLATVFPDAESEKLNAIARISTINRKGCALDIGSSDGTRICPSDTVAQPLTLPIQS